MRSLSLSICKLISGLTLHITECESGEVESLWILEVDLSRGRYSILWFSDLGFSWLCSVWTYVFAPP